MFRNIAETKIKKNIKKYTKKKTTYLSSLYIPPQNAASNIRRCVVSKKSYKQNMKSNLF